MWIALLVIAVALVVSRVFMVSEDGTLNRQRRNQIGVAAVLLVVVAIAFLA